MKKIILGLIINLLFLEMAYAQCQLNLSHAQIDYGTVNARNLTTQQKRWKTLNERQVQLTAICDAPTKIAVFAQGNTLDEGFRLASDSALLITASNAILDGNPVMLGKMNEHTPFILNNVSNDKTLLLASEGVAPVRNEQIQAGQQFSVTLTIKPALSSRDTEINDSTVLESNLHFTLETTS